MSENSHSFSDIRKQVLGHTKQFQLLDKELCEALLYRSTRSFGVLTGRDIADLLFIHTMLLYVLAQESQTEKYAQDYAYDTIKFGTYALFRTHATDIYLLAYTVLVDHSTQVKLKNHIESRDLLDSLQFNRKQHVDFLRRISTGDETTGIAVSYLYRLETQLRVENPRLKFMRRSVVTWHTMSQKQKARFYSMVYTELMRITYGGARNAELVKFGIRNLIKGDLDSDK